MKKIIFALMIVSLALPAFAQELKISGEAKSGVLWEQLQREGQDPDATVKLNSKDDAGSQTGRYRLNLEYDNGNGFGMKARLNQESFNDPPQWPYAFGYGNFFEEQMTVSVGKLGGSPWGTGGPEMWKELEMGGPYAGMRVEYKPAWMPVGKLNVGLVLNYFNSDLDQGKTTNVSLLSILRETVLGASYTHDLFMARLAYRFDDGADAIQGVSKMTGGTGEDELVYRIEEYAIRNYLPGFSIWALGHLFGVTAEIKEVKLFRNWLFVEYAPDMFTAQVRIGYDYIESRSDFYVKPSFYWHFFNKLLSVGAAFEYCQDFGDGKIYEGSSYRYIMVEPKIQLNFTSSYIAFAYNFRQEYDHPWTGLREGKEPLKQTQWMNLRFCIYY
jgi:hypothetical protein